MATCRMCNCPADRIYSVRGRRMCWVCRRHVALQHLHRPATCAFCTHDFTRRGRELLEAAEWVIALMAIRNPGRALPPERRITP